MWRLLAVFDFRQKSLRESRTSFWGMNEILPEFTFFKIWMKTGTESLRATAVER
jgi:hypothetical protein